MKTRGFGLLLALFAFSQGMVWAAARQQTGVAVDDYPNKPIRLVCPVSPGGANETAARMWQPYFEKEIGVPLIVDCIPGADGVIGGRVVAEAPADGYTFIHMTASSAPAQTLFLNAPFKVEDFEMIVTYFNDPLVIVSHKDSPWRTMQDLIKYAKSQPPETISFGLTNLSTVDVIALRLIEQREGIKFNLVPFQGGNPARMALAGKHIDAMFPSFFGSSSIWEYIRVLAVAQEKNLIPQLTENAPTLSEVLGYKLPELYDTTSVYSPAGFETQHPERYKKFTDALNRAFGNPEYKAALEKNGQIGRFRVLTIAESKKVAEDMYTLYKDNIGLLKQ